MRLCLVRFARGGDDKVDNNESADNANNDVDKVHSATVGNDANDDYATIEFEVAVDAKRRYFSANLLSIFKKFKYRNHVRMMKARRRRR
jgi:hypothetical protein